VLAAVENQNSHTCDLDQRRLERKGRRSALTAVAHWFGWGYKLTPDARVPGRRARFGVLPVPVSCTCCGWTAASLSCAIDDSMGRA
jgi:hypothetical protein